jgi:flavin reductase (DIM6/NTAB) family NADH-FMN oxidoreductase RutF
MPKEIDNHVPRKDFINAMRSVASPVTVVTTDGPYGRYGATVSAFSSVSADPPTVLVCLNAESRIASAVKENGQFCVNVLSNKAKEIANRFAGLHDRWIDDRFSGIDCFGSHGMSPIIDGGPSFLCAVTLIVKSGTHLIVTGQVQSISGDCDCPLIWRDGDYHTAVRERCSGSSVAEA